MRILQQCQIAYAILTRLKNRDEDSIRAIEEALQAADQSIYSTEDAKLRRKQELFEQCKQRLDAIRENTSLPKIAMAVVQDRFGIGYTTALTWYREFKRIGGFHEDGRGKSKRDWILGQTDLKLQFKAWIRENQRGLTISKAYRYVNEELLASEALVPYFKSHNLERPVAMSTVHSWMLRLDCKYEKHKKTYYTDGHNRPDVKKDRVDHSKKMDYLSLRLPLWIQVPLDKVPSTVPEAEIHRFTALEAGADGTPVQREYAEIHVDMLGVSGDQDLFTETRGALPLGGKFSVRFRDATECRHNHARFAGNPCRCEQEAIEVGQDETVFCQNNYLQKQWSVDDYGELRAKNQGVSIMASVFQSEVLGFGFQLSEEEFKKYNANRQARGKTVLLTQPGLQLLHFGLNKDGYWNYEKFAQQVEDFMDMFEWKFPNKQLILKIDWSAGHAKNKEDGLNVNNMNVMWGGKQGALRTSKVTAEGLGPGAAMQTVTNADGTVTVHDLKLKPGQEQKFNFEEGDLPPFFDPTAPKEQYIDPQNPKKTVKERKSRKNPTPTSKEVDNVIEGYIGKPKGMKQILWERGLWKEGMTADNKDPLLNMKAVLGNCPDFAGETSAMQDLVESRGHILVMTPKYSPEVAGNGIEFSFGFSKMKYRKEFNDYTAKNLQKNVERALSRDVVTLDLSRKFARRARDYLRAYANPTSPEHFKDIERMCKVVKAHRSILDVDTGFLAASGVTPMPRVTASGVTTA